MPRGSVCKAKGCNATKDTHPQLRFHSFPNNKERFRLWADRIGRPDLKFGDRLDNRMSYRLCSLHFEEKMYMSPGKNSRLIWNAEPTQVSDGNTEASETAANKKQTNDDTEDNQESSISVKGTTSFTKVSQRLPNTKSGKMFDWSLALDDVVIIKEEIMTDQDDSEANDSSSLVPKKSVKHDSKEGIRMHIKSEKLSVEEISEEQTNEVESAQKRILAENTEERISLQESPGTSNCEDYRLFMSATDDSSTDSAEEYGAEDRQTDSSEKNNSKVGQNVSSSVASTLDPSESIDHQKKIKVRRVKKDPQESAVASVLPRIKKEINISQQMSTVSGSDNVASEGNNEATVPILTRIKKEPVNLSEVMNMENEQELSEASKDCASKNDSSGDRLSSMVRRTYSGPIRRQVIKTKDGSKRTFMILNKNSLKALQARGLIQHIKTIGNGQSTSKPVIACKSILPAFQQDQKNKVLVTPNELMSTKNKETEQVGMPSRVDLPTPVSSGVGETPLVVSWAATSATNTSAITFTIQLPGKDNDGTTPQKAVSGSSLRQIVTPPVFIQSSSTNPSIASGSQLRQYGIKREVTSTSSGLTYTSGGVSRPSVSFSQLTSTPTCTSTSKLQSKWDASQSNIEEMEMSCDSPPAEPSSPPEFLVEGNGEDKVESIPLPEELLNGPFKVRKGFKIFRCDKSAKNNQTPMKNVRWIAMPTLPVSATLPVRAPVPPNFRKTQPTVHPSSAASINLPTPSSSTTVKATSSINLPVSSQSSPYIFNITKDVFRDSERSYERAKKALKEKYKRLLNKHRQRYYLLLKKFRALERRFSAVEDAGTREQVVRDARRYLSEDHLLFMESQMFLRNRTGKGNRFSKKFIRLMIRLYESSPAGYRFLRTVFTIPSVKTVQKWQNRLFDILDDNEKDPLAITGNAASTEQQAANITSGDAFILQQEGVATTSSDNTADRPFQGSTTLFRSVEAPGRPETDHSSSGSGTEDSEEELDEDEEEEDFEDEIQTKDQTEKTIYQNNATRSSDEITIAWEEPWSSVMN